MDQGLLHRVGSFSGAARPEKLTSAEARSSRFQHLLPRTFTFQTPGTTSRRFFHNPEVDENIYRTGNGFGYYYNLNRSGRSFTYQLNGQGKRSPIPGPHNPGIEIYHRPRGAANG